MTTGCDCGTPGCGGTAHEPGGRCARCQTEAMLAGAGRTLGQIVQAALYGQAAAPGGRSADKEAGA